VTFLLPECNLSSYLSDAVDELVAPALTQCTSPHPVCGAAPKVVIYAVSVHPSGVAWGAHYANAGLWKGGVAGRSGAKSLTMALEATDNVAKQC
jgi:hypothetical protein